jgi:predicted TIM-barrel fold metal-dependent hydrolase
VASAQPQQVDAIPIIDVHTHTSFTGGNDPNTFRPQTMEQYFKEWREAGIVGAVAHTTQDGKNFYNLASRNVIYCGGVGDRIDLNRIENALKAGVFRCIKIYLGYTHRYAYDRRYEPVYALAQKYDVPVVFHTGDTYSKVAKLKFADPLTIDEVAVDHPKVKFVIAHCGNPWIESAAEVAYKNPNVYLECSAMLTGDLDQAPPEKVEAYVIKPIAWIFGYVEDPKKLMFGTDWPLVSMKPYVEAYKRAIPKEHWKAVFHDNAVRVFKLRMDTR